MHYWLLPNQKDSEYLKTQTTALVKYGKDVDINANWKNIIKLSDIWELNISIYYLIFILGESERCHN